MFASFKIILSAVEGSKILQRFDRLVEVTIAGAISCVGQGVSAGELLTGVASLGRRRIAFVRCRQAPGGNAKADQSLQDTKTQTPDRNLTKQSRGEPRKMRKLHFGVRVASYPGITLRGQS